MTGAVMLATPAEAAGRDESWLAARRLGISASDIAAVLGISTWQSPFSLYWSKVNGWELDENEDMHTGRLVEPATADWFAHEHRDTFDVQPAGLYASGERPWQLATPDRLLVSSHDDSDDAVLGVLECKWVAYSWDGWGDPGGDDLPVHYLAQVQWQCDVLDVHDWHLAALGPGGFRAYHGRRDERDLRTMRAAGQAFWDRLQAGDPPPVDDGHPATLRTLKQLHPSVSDVDVDTDVQFAEGYRRARDLRDRASAVVDRYENRIRDLIGDGRRLMCNGRLVASRSVYDRKPYEVGPTTIDKLNPGRSKSYA